MTTPLIDNLFPKPTVKQLLFASTLATAASLTWAVQTARADHLPQRTRDTLGTICTNTLEQGGHGYCERKYQRTHEGRDPPPDMRPRDYDPYQVDDPDYEYARNPDGTYLETGE